MKKKLNLVLIFFLCYINNLCTSKTRSSPLLVCLVLSGILNGNYAGKISLELTESKIERDGEDLEKSRGALSSAAAPSSHLSQMYTRMSEKVTDSVASFDSSLQLLHINQAGLLLST